MHAFATPLVTRTDGTKYGKTEGGALWLDPEMLSPYAFYQFWLNVEDEKVGELLRAFTFLSHAEIEDLEAQTAEKPFLRAGQKALAEHMTTLVHGARETEQIKAASAALFGGGALTRPRRADARGGAARGGLHRGVRRRRDPERGRPVRRGRAVEEQGRGQTHGRRGRRLPEQPARRGPRARALPRTTCSAAPGWCCAGARSTWRESRSWGDLPAVRRHGGAARSRAAPRAGAPLRPPGRPRRHHRAEASLAWDRFRFLPQVLRDVTRVDLRTSVLGTPLRSPFAVAPTAMQRAVHPDGEAEMARGVAAAGSLMVVSSNAGSTFEDDRRHRGRRGGPRST